MATIYINNRAIRLNPNDSVGKGGEADVYKVGEQAVKIFKNSSHPDLMGDFNAQRAAERRLAEHQKKLPALMQLMVTLRANPGHGLQHVVAPQELATDKSGRRILGYDMPMIQDGEVLLRYGQRSYREGNVSDEAVVWIFRDMHTTITNLHRAGFVIGDFNDLNVLVSGREAHFIDIDSFQFGTFFTKVFSAGFVDPLLCDLQQKHLLLCKPHNANSDWYAFRIMLMQTLLYLMGGPYGGVYRPKDKTKRIGHEARPLHRITVFHPEVRYPKPSRHFGILPDDLLADFNQTFVEDRRDPFPVGLFDAFRFTADGTLSDEKPKPPEEVKVVTSTGKVHVERVFRTSGHILFSTVQGGKLRYLYHEEDEYFREDGRKLFSGSIIPRQRICLQGESTIIAQGGTAIFLAPDGKASRLSIDKFGNIPVIDANEKHCYWLAGGKLHRSGSFGGVEFSEEIATVLAGQTMFWVGGRFGFGFYRAGNLTQCFTFGAEKGVLQDHLTLQPFKGQLIDAKCYFGHKCAWFLVSNRVVNQHGHAETQHNCYLIHEDGTVVASAETVAYDGSWLGTLRGKCAIGDFLLAATDDGIVRIRANNGTLNVDKEFPDAARFVSSDHRLHNHNGILVVDRRHIWRITIK